MKNIVLFGPPGSGKGTQASNIISKYYLVHLSTGDMLRAEIAAQTALGLEAKTLMDKGELVPDAVVIGMIENKINANPVAAGFVFDGFPRTVAQAKALDGLLVKKNAPISKVLSLVVSEEELTKRILERGKTSGRADDQNEEIVRNRVAEYRAKTEPLAGYYSAQGKLVEVPGEGTIEHIADMLYYEIDSIQAEEPALPPAAEEKALPPATPERVLPVAKPAAKKAVKKTIPQKPAAKKAPKKAAKKAATPKPVAKKAAKKAAPKKKTATKKVVKKAAPQKTAKKPIVKKQVKKAAPKKAVKKAVSKKAIKKAPIKKVVAKKVVKKTAPKKVVKKTPAKKIVAKKIAKKAAPKKVVAKKAVKKAAPKKAAKKAATKKKR